MFPCKSLLRSIKLPSPWEPRSSRHPPALAVGFLGAALIPSSPQNVSQCRGSRDSRGPAAAGVGADTDARLLRLGQTRLSSLITVSFACWMSRDVNCIPGVGTACVGGDHGRPRSMQIKSNCSPYWVFPAVRNVMSRSLVAARRLCKNNSLI